MRFTKGEQSFAFALLVIACLICVVYGTGYLYQRYWDEQDVVEQEARNRTIAQNERIVLDSRDESEPLPSGREYRAIPWNGSLAVTILDAKAFRDASDAQAYLGDDRPFFAPEEWLAELPGVIVITMELENIDARNDDYENPYEFNMWDFPPNRSEEIIGFDSPVDDPENGQPWKSHVELKPGERKTVKVAYSLNDWEDAASFGLHLGAGAPRKYRFELEVEEVEPGEGSRDLPS